MVIVLRPCICLVLTPEARKVLSRILKHPEKKERFKTGGKPFPLTYVITLYKLCIYKENAMIKHLTVHGNSSALLIEKPILELLKITLKTPLQVTTDGRNLIISPVKDMKREKKFLDAMKKVNERHAKTFKALAG